MSHHSKLNHYLFFVFFFVLSMNSSVEFKTCP